MDITIATCNALKNRIGHLFNNANSKDINLNILTEFVCWLQSLQYKCYYTDLTNKMQVQPNDMLYFYINSHEHRNRWGRYNGYIEKVKRKFDWYDYLVHGKEEQIEIIPIFKTQIYKMDVMLEILVRYDVIRLILSGNRHLKASARYVFTSQFINEVLDELRTEHKQKTTDLKFGCIASDKPSLYTDKENFLYEELLNSKIRISPKLTMCKAIQLLESSEKVKQIDKEILKLGKVDSLDYEYNQLINKRMNLMQVSLISLEKFVQKDIYVKEDMLTGRLYSSFSSLPRLFRKYIQICDNKKYKYLYSYDLKSAQPFLLLSLLKKEDGIDMKEVNAFEDIILNHDIYNFCLEKQFPYKIKKCESYQKNGEHKRYTKLEDGQTIKDRAEMKKAFMHYMYYEPAKNKTIPIVGQILEKEFPTVYKGINKLKMEYDNFACEMQKLEANIFIDAWWSLKNHSVLPLHDGLYFIPRFKKEVLEALKTSFLKNGISNVNLHFEKVKESHGELCLDDIDISCKL